jgi:hypothetical protein
MSAACVARTLFDGSAEVVSEVLRFRVMFDHIAREFDDSSRVVPG